MSINSDQSSLGASTTGLVGTSVVLHLNYVLYNLVWINVFIV